MRIWRALERLRAGDLAGAHDDLTAARASARAQRGADLVALADVGLGDLARGRGDLAEARARLTGALTSLGQVASLEAETSRIPALTGLGRVALAECDPAGAQAHLDAALALALKIGLGPVIATVAEALAALAVARASCAEAARLLGLAAAARGAADRGSPDVDHTEAAARAGLADLAGRFDAEFAAAASLSSAEAVTALSRLAARTA